MNDSLTENKPPQTSSTISQRFHGSRLRGIESVTSSFSTQGRFGRMFRNVPIFEHQPDNLENLAKSMIAPNNPDDLKPVPIPFPLDEQENPIIPAGYTYFGQFIDHDITFDPTSSLQRQNDPDALHNFRTPRFDLDSVYGLGPSGQPYLYVSGNKPVPHPKYGFDQRGIMFLFDERETVSELMEADLPRNFSGRAVIGDPRNDENLIISQLQLTFLKFHNRLVEYVFLQSGLTGEDLFLEAQRLVRWHYQWAVVHDFLPRIIDGNKYGEQFNQPNVVDDIIIRDEYVIGQGKKGRIFKKNLKFYRWREEPFLPVEFSVAAYRFGHSMVRPSYFINDFVREERNSVRIPVFSGSDDPLENLNGFRPLPENWGIDWKYFFEVNDNFPPQLSYRIDTKLALPLSNLPGFASFPNLAHRNLLRGLRMSLPSGQSVANAMGIQPLANADLELKKRGASNFMGDAPLWFYILREAEVLNGGTHLGPVGGRIVAEVLLGLIFGDSLSWINIEPNWQPPLMQNGHFGMPELVSFAQNYVMNQENTTNENESKTTAYTRWRATFPNVEIEESTFPPVIKEENNSKKKAKKSTKKAKGKK